MSVTPPVTMSAAPATPDRADRATFAARAVALDDFRKNVNIPEMQAAVDNVYANALDAHINATAAAGAAEAAGAAVWVSGTTYAAGDCRYSPANYQTYRRKTAGAGTTDPSLDGTNWARLDLAAPTVVRSARTSNTMLGVDDRATLIDITSGTFSQTFDAAVTLTAGWWCWLRNSGTGTVTLDPDGAELIDGAATATVAPGFTVLVMCSGTALHTVSFAPEAGDHAVKVTAGNGHGSTNTKIRRFTTTEYSTGSHITYADSATLGASFTIAAGGAGLYACEFSDNTGASASAHGISLNSAQLTTGITAITDANRLTLTYCDADVAMPCTTVVRLAAGDVVRPHTMGTQDETFASRTWFSIRKIGA